MRHNYAVLFCLRFHEEASIAPSVNVERPTWHGLVKSGTGVGRGIDGGTAK